MNNMQKSAVQCPVCHGEDPACKNCADTEKAFKPHEAPKLSEVKTVTKCNDTAVMSKGTEEATELLKAMSAAVAGAIGRRRRMEQVRAEVSSPETVVDAVYVGALRERPSFEPPVVPIRHIDPPAAMPFKTPDFLMDCQSCGYIHKSLEDCPRCSRLNKPVEAKPFWSR